MPMMPPPVRRTWRKVRGVEPVQPAPIRLVPRCGNRRSAEASIFSIARVMAISAGGHLRKIARQQDFVRHGEPVSSAPSIWWDVILVIGC